MKHTITIPKENFINCDYGSIKNCALATALKNHFPDATYVCVGGIEFDTETPDFKITDKYFRDCQLVSCDYIIEDTYSDYCYISKAIWEMSYKTDISEVHDLTFSFETD